MWYVLHVLYLCERGPVENTCWSTVSSYFVPVLSTHMWEGFKTNLTICRLLRPAGLLNNVKEDCCFRGSVNWVKPGLSLCCVRLCTYYVPGTRMLCTGYEDTYVAYEGTCVCVTAIPVKRVSGDEADTLPVTVARTRMMHVLYLTGTRMHILYLFRENIYCCKRYICSRIYHVRREQQRVDTLKTVQYVCERNERISRRYLFKPRYFNFNHTGPPHQRDHRPQRDRPDTFRPLSLSYRVLVPFILF